MNEGKTHRIISQRNMLNSKARELTPAFQAKQITLAAFKTAEVVNWPQRGSAAATRVACLKK
jgi:hypothetical protein